MIKYIKLYDLIGFKICWFLCACCSVWEQPYLGPIVTLLFILIHLTIVKFKSRDIQVIIIAILCGLFFDSIFSYFNLINYKGGILSYYNLAPLWILSMWAGFSLTMIYTLERIKEKYFISSLLGFVGGPLSYSAGVGIGSLDIQTNFAYVFLAVSWAIVVPLLFRYVNSFD